MAHMGAELTELARGSCTLAVDRRPELLQQHGLFHGGVTAFLVDNATTIAAAASRGQPALTAEYKLNPLSPASGHRLICRARVHQARTSGRGRRRGCVLRDRRRRKTHRDRIGFDRDAREAAGTNPKPGLMEHRSRKKRKPFFLKDHAQKNDLGVRFNSVEPELSGPGLAMRLDSGAKSLRYFSDAASPSGSSSRRASGSKNSPAAASASAAASWSS